jgi:uncharacterized protein (TIGR02246 family)
MDEGEPVSTVGTSTSRKEAAMPRSLGVTLVAVLASALLTAAHAYPDDGFLNPVVLAQGAAEPAVHEFADRWAAAFNAGDLDALTDLYTEGALFADTFGRFVGREAIRGGITTALPVTIGEDRIDISTDEVEILGDTAHSLGTYVISASDGSMLTQGSWLLVSKRVEGAWKMHRHVVSMLMPGPDDETRAAVVQRVHGLVDRWAELFNAHDFRGVANLYTEDAIVVNFDGRAAEGRDAIYASLAELPAQVGEGTIAITADEVEIFGDTAYAMGTYTLSAPDGSIMMQGTYTALDRLVDGDWQMHRHVVNMLMPEPEASAP